MNTLDTKNVRLLFFGLVPVFVTSQGPLDYNCLCVELFYPLHFKQGVMAVLKHKTIVAANN